MSDSQSNGNGTGPRRRRGKRFLSPSEKYEIWLSLVRGEYTIAAAAEQAGVDRSTVMKLQIGRAPGRAGGAGGVEAGREVRQRPGPRAGGGQGGDRAALGGAEGDGRQVDAGRGKRALGLSGRVPRRVDAATKPALLELDRLRRRRRLGSPPRLRVPRARRGPGVALARAPGRGHARRPAAGRASGARDHARRGAGDPRPLRGLSGDRPLPPQARAPRLLPGPGVGLALHGAARPRHASAPVPATAPRRALRAPAVPGVGELRAPLDLDLRHHPLRALQAHVRDDDHGPGHAQVDLRDRLAPRRPPPRSSSPSRTRSSSKACSTVDAHQHRLADPTVEDPERPVLLAVSDNGPQMTSGSHARVHGHVRDRPALRAARHPDRPGLDREPVRPHQGRVAAPGPDPRPGRPARRARQRPPRLQHPAPARRHRLRHPRRRTRRPRPRRSARPAAPACTAPAGCGSPTTAASGRTPHDHNA